MNVETTIGDSSYNKVSFFTSCSEAVLKILIGTPLQPLKELTYSSPYPTPLPPTPVSEEKGLLVRPFQG
jgi:hypothetical protein